MSYKDRKAVTVAAEADLPGSERRTDPSRSRHVAAKKLGGSASEAGGEVREGRGRFTSLLEFTPPLRRVNNIREESSSSDYQLSKIAKTRSYPDDLAAVKVLSPAICTIEDTRARDWVKERGAKRVAVSTRRRSTQILDRGSW